MRILLVSHHAPPHVGGLENLVSLEAEALHHAGHEVTWLTTRPHRATLPHATATPASQPGVTLHRVGACHAIERWTNVAYPLPAPAFFTAARRLASDADVVHTHGFVFATSILAALACPRPTPLLLTDHGGILRYRSRIATLALRGLIETAGRWVTRHATRAIAYNSEVESLLARLAGDPRRVVFLPNPVGTAAFSPVEDDQRRGIRRRLGWDDAPRVLFVGRLVQDKGIDTVAGAADPAYRLVFVGPGDARTVARLRNAGEVLSPRPQARLADLYRAADALVLPSWNEGFPVVIQEALCCGCPVLTSDTAAYDRYRSLPGLHMAPSTIEAVRTGLRDLLARVQDRDAIARSARSFFPDADAWVREVLALAQPPPVGGAGPVVR